LPFPGQPQLPMELVEHIIQEAWRTSERERWKLYGRLSLVSHQWHALIRETATRHVIVDSPADVYAYEKVIGRKTLRLTVDRDIMHGVLCHRRIHMAEKYLAAYFDTVRDFVPLCCSVSLVLGNSDPRGCGPEEVSAKYAQIFRSVSEFRSLTSLVLSWTPNCPSEQGVPNVSLPTVTFLRLQRLPCYCTECGHDIHTNGPGCLTHGLLRSFPNLRHLHLEYYIFLKSLKLPRTVEGSDARCAALPCHCRPSAVQLRARLEHRLRAEQGSLATPSGMVGGCQRLPHPRCPPGARMRL